MYFKGLTFRRESRAGAGKVGVSKKSIFTRIALQMKIVTVVQIFAHTRSHTHSDKLERKVTCSVEHSSSPSPSSRQIPIVTQWFALTKSGQAYCDETLVYGLKCCEKQNHKEHATLHLFFLSIDSFRKRHLASLPCFGCAGPTRSTATADFRRYYCWFTSTLGARSLCNPVKQAAAV